MGHKEAQKAQRINGRSRFLSSTFCAFGASLWLCSVLVVAQESRNLTPLQIEIEKQQQRLSSSDQEERRDAVMKLSGLRVAAASRAALPAVTDPSPIIRAIA